MPYSLKIKKYEACPRNEGIIMYYYLEAQT